MYFVFNLVGLGIFLVGLMLGLGLEWAGVSEAVFLPIVGAVVFAIDFMVRYREGREHKWKRFFIPSTGGQWFWIPCWCWVFFFLFLGVRSQFESKAKRAKREIREFEQAFEKYTGPIPEKSGVRQIKGELDPWGNAYNWLHPNSRTEDGRPAIWSNGPNGINEDGAGDDINNWDATRKRPPRQKIKWPSRR